MLSEANILSRRNVYVGAGPKGRYYYESTRKLVPKQLLKNKDINPEFDITKYNVVDKPAPRPKEISSVDYSLVRQIDNLVLHKKLTLSDVDVLSSEVGWTLTNKARRAFINWGKDPQELKDILMRFKETYSECNTLDYDIKDNRFIGKWRTVTKVTKVTEESVVDEVVAGVCICD